MEDLEHPEKRKFSHTEDDDESVYIDGPGRKKLSCDSNIPSNISVSVIISGPVDSIDSILPKDNHEIRELFSTSGCTIAIDQTSFIPSPNRKVVLQGSPTMLAQALNTLSECSSFRERKEKKLTVIERSYSPCETTDTTVKDLSLTSLSFDKSEKEIIKCPHAKVGSLIGHRGVTVNEIYRRTGCRIQVNQEGIPEGDDRIVQFIGDETQINQARVLVEGIIEHGPNFLLKQSSVTSTTVVTTPTSSSSSSSSSSTSYLSSTNNISNTFNTSTTTTTTSNPSTPAATTAILYKEEFDVLPSKVGGIIGTKGTIISEIIKRSGCKIQIDQNFPEGHQHKVRIHGDSQDKVDIARCMIEDIIKYGVSSFAKYDSHIHISQDFYIFDYQFKRLLNDNNNNNSFHELQVICGIKLKIDMNISQTTDNMAIHKITLTGDLKRVQLGIKGIVDVLGLSLESQSQSRVVRTSIHSPSDILLLSADSSSLHSNNKHIIIPSNTNGISYMTPATPGTTSTLNSIANTTVYYPNTSTTAATATITPAAHTIEYDTISRLTTATTKTTDRSHIPPPPSSSSSSSSSSTTHLIPSTSMIPLTSTSTTNNNNTNNTNNTTHTTSTSIPVYTQELGVDGVYGAIHSLTVLPDGMHHAIAEVKNEYIGKIIGKGGANLTLIRNKSGACLQVMKHNNCTVGYTQITLVGLPQCVTTAGDIFKEILCNGTLKLISMPDVPPSVPSNYTTSTLSRPSTTSLTPNPMMTSHVQHIPTPMYTTAYNTIPTVNHHTVVSAGDMRHMRSNLSALSVGHVTPVNTVIHGMSHHPPPPPPSTYTHQPPMPSPYSHHYG